MNKHLIYKEVDISAGHFLRNVPEDHKCARPHGHNYKVEIWVVGNDAHLPENGMILDFGVISEAVKQWDHIVLNDHPPFSEDLNPTAENLALFLRKDIAALGQMPSTSVSVRVWETPDCWAWSNPELLRGY